MRKISAHYYLKSSGTFGKRPIIEVNHEGLITAVRELGDNFREEPGLEYFPGIIVPGFVASVAGDDISTVQKLGLTNGVLRLQAGSALLALDDYQQAWTSIKAIMEEQGVRASLAHYLQKHTLKAAQMLGKAEWGVIETGAQPGLLVLQNIDLRSFVLTSKASFKILQK